MATQQSSEGASEPTDLGPCSIFDYYELQKATKFFNPSEVVGEGGFGTVYRGKLEDGRAVAIKEHNFHHKKRAEQFLNEVKLVSQFRHRNLVTLYGYTDPEEGKMLLVYEFAPNGTVADHLHDKQFSKMAWPQRLRIAIQTAEALDYLHSLQPAVVHRDVKTDNILLDNNFNVKVADFGLSRLLPLSRAHISTMPQGTQGYLDPEYHQCYKLTTKSDVYSFGVVLMELISGKTVLDYEGRDDEEVWLVNMAFNKMKNDQLEQLVDPELGYLEDTNTFYMVESVAQLAYDCLQPKGSMRPLMTGVLKSLHEISDYKEIQEASKRFNYEIGGASTSVFDYKEIQEASKKFKSSKWVGRCDFGKEYQGELRDGRAVIIKKLNLSSHKKSIEQLLNEVKLISRLSHKNLLRFYGYTNLKDEKMFLVHEFTPNGTVADHLHRSRFPKKVFTWSQRLRIAIETAEALAFLHSLQPPIIHRNVKTDNILLDDSFNVQVVNFGLCNLLSPWDSTQGYVDPEYNRIYKLTAKSDVYSFGVVLIELISGKGVLDIQRSHDQVWLVRMASNIMKSNHPDHLFDLKLGCSKDPKVFSMVSSVAELAFECLKTTGYSRPHMMDVLKSLKKIGDADTSTSRH